MTSGEWKINHFRWFLPAFAVGFYLLIFAWMLSSALRQNGGRFSYALDDTYIHLALSDNIAHGTYGVNPGETTSPSSSLLWPFLLAPAAGFSWHVYLPLVLNLLFGAAAAALFGMAAARWRVDPDGRSDIFRRSLSVVALVLVANLPGLALIAMEHSLQVLVAGICAWGIASALRGEKVPNWCLAAALLAPSIRYEGVGLTLALAVALWGSDERRRTLLLSLSLLPLAAFGLFLRAHGLPMLPLSVLVKARAVGATQDPAGALSRHFGELFASLWNTPNLWILALLLAGLLAASWNERDRPRRFAIAGVAMAAGLHLIIGRFGWLNRYEPYILVFALLTVLELTWERPRALFGLYATALFGCCLTTAQAMSVIPDWAHWINLQQVQTARFLHSMPQTNVAVNDLGTVSYRHPPSQYVLDLVGLANMEVARSPRSTQWMDTLTRSHRIGLVAIYPSWFPPVPSTWTEIGHSCIESGPWPALRCVHFYATGLEPVGPLRERFAAYAKTLPPGTDTQVSATPAAP